MRQRSAVVGLIGTGVVGSEVASQLTARQLSKGVLCPFAYPELRIGAVMNSKRMVLCDEKDLLLQTTTTLLSKLNDADSSIPADADQLVDHLLTNGSATAVIVDCTSSEQIAKQYSRWMRKGAHVVTPNKIAFSSSIDLFREIRNIQQTSQAMCLHEATVGAGLPIISTLSDMIITGDQIVCIEGILSGTLSYLFNTFSKPDCTTPFSQLVKDAQAKGFTEPDPRDDLNGKDFARKVVILGRCIGLNLDLSTLPVENIVPEALRSLSTASEFLERLPEYDAYFTNLRDQAIAAGDVLRYVGVVDGIKGSSVQLRRYPQTHPFASLKGSANVISFTTARYPDSLIIQGAGAGAAVTAMGVFSDILKVVGMRHQ